MAYGGYEGYITDLNGGAPLAIAATTGLSYMQAYSLGEGANSAWQFGNTSASTFGSSFESNVAQEGDLNAAWDASVTTVKTIFAGPSTGAVQRFAANKIADWDIREGSGMNDTGVDDTNTVIDYAFSSGWPFN